VFGIFHAGGSFGEDWSLSDSQRQPNSTVAPLHLPGPQARVGPLQRVCSHHQELHQNLHRRQARVASQGCPAVLRHEQLSPVRGEAATGADHRQDQQQTVPEGLLRGDSHIKHKTVQMTLVLNASIFCEV